MLLCALDAGAGTPNPPCEVALGSLAQMGRGLLQQLGDSAAAARVSVISLKSDRELPDPAALRERVRSAIAAAVHGSSQQTAPGGLTLEIGIEKSGGVLRVSADLRRAGGLWRRLHRDRSSAERHAFVEVPLDAELRTLIPPPPLVVSETIKLKAPERGTIALGCGGLGPDGAQELALVSRSSIRVGHVVRGTFVERKRAAWSALSPVAAVPLREPIATAEVTRLGLLRVGSSDRRDGLELSPELTVTRRFEGLLPVAAETCSARTGIGYAAQLTDCASRSSVATSAAPVVADAWAGLENWAVAREAVSAQLVKLGSRSLAEPLRVGAQLALGDADNDGSPELAYSRDSLDPADDRLTIVTLEDQRAVRRFEVPAPGITAIAICNRVGPTMAPIVIATGDELWILR